MNELKEKDIQFIDNYIWFDVPTERGGYEEWCVKKETLLKIIGTVVQQPLSGFAEASPKCQRCGDSQTITVGGFDGTYDIPCPECNR